MAVDLLDLGEFTGREDEGGRFDPIDSGNYRASIFGVSREVGKSSGKPYLHWEFVIAEGEPFAGRHLFDNTSLSDAAKWRLVQLLKSAGVDVPKGRLQLNPADLLGRELILAVGQEPDDYHDPDGDEELMRNVVKGFRPARSIAKPKIDIPASAPKKTPKATEDDSADELPFTPDAPSEASKPKRKRAAKKPAPASEPEPEPAPADDADDDDDFDFE